MNYQKNMLIQRQNPCLKLPWSYWKTLILKRSLLSLWAGQNQIYSSQMVTGLRRFKMMMMMMVTLSLVSRDLDHFFDNSDTERKSPKRNSRNYTWNEIIQWMMKVYSPCLKERSFWEELFLVEYFFWHWIIHKSLHLTLWSSSPSSSQLSTSLSLSALLLLLSQSSSLKSWSLSWSFSSFSPFRHIFCHDHYHKLFNITTSLTTSSVTV